MPEARDQRAEQQLLHHAHPRIRRHLECPQLEEAAPPGCEVGRVELVDAELRAMRVARDVDKQVAQRAIDEPRGRLALRRSKPRERDLHLVQAVVPSFVEPRRLARGPEKHPGEEVRERRVIVPVGDQTAEQIGTPEKRAVCRRRAAQHEVIAPAGARVPAVEHELLGGEACVPCVLVERGRRVDELMPVRGRVHVHFDDARIRRDEEMGQPRIARRRIPFQEHAHPERARGRLDRGDEIEVVVHRLDRRHEDVQDSAPRLHAQRRTNHARGRCSAHRRRRQGAAGCLRPARSHW